MALNGVPRAWLLNLPASSVASWEGLHDLFLAHYAAPMPGGLQAPPSDRHAKPFFRQISIVLARLGAPPGWVAPKADLTFDSKDRPVNTACSGALPMLCTPTICHVAITKTLIDGGAGLNVLSVEAFSLLHVPPEGLQPSRPFLGVGAGSTAFLGTDPPSSDHRHL